MGFLGLEVWEEGDGEEGERMKTPTPTRTWGGWGGVFWGIFSCFFLLRWGLGCSLVLERVVVVIFSCVWE